jgi:hypothetical protein
MHTNSLTIIVGDFNVNMLIDIPQSKILRTYMDKYEFKKKIFKNTTLNNNTQIYHIWTNAPTQQCHVASTKAYWTNHKPIYIYCI